MCVLYIWTQIDNNTAGLGEGSLCQIQTLIDSEKEILTTDQRLEEISTFVKLVYIFNTLFPIQSTFGVTSVWNVWLHMAWNLF